MSGEFIEALETKIATQKDAKSDICIICHL